MNTTWNACVAASWLAVTLATRADEQLATLKVGNFVYTNVTVTAVTKTDLYFTHAGGMGNLKLKYLDPELRNHFGYDAAKAGEVERNQRDANKRYGVEVATHKPAARRPPAGASRDRAERDDVPDLAASSIRAKSFRGQAAPGFVVEKWLTPAPDSTGKFVLIDFWATWCGPCRQSIPLLNSIHQAYGDRIIVVGLSSESEANVRRMTSPQIEYAVAIDTHRRMYDAVGVQAIPHALLIDPKGIVRFEGHPSYLNNKAGLEQLLGKYAD